MRRFVEVWRAHRVLVSAFVLASAVTLVFLGRFAFGVVYWSQHRDEPVKPWMTVGYVGRSWGVAPRALDAEAGLPPPNGHPLTLAEIAEARGVPVEDVIAEVEAALVRLGAAGDDGEARP